MTILKENFLNLDPSCDLQSDMARMTAAEGAFNMAFDSATSICGSVPFVIQPLPEVRMITPPPDLLSFKVPTFMNLQEFYSP